jgi:hypothetical protein
MHSIPINGISVLYVTRTIYRAVIFVNLITVIMCLVHYSNNVGNNIQALKQFVFFVLLELIMIRNNITDFFPTSGFLNNAEVSNLIWDLCTVDSIFVLLDNLLTLALLVALVAKQNNTNCS